MCGIVGIIDLKGNAPPDEDRIRRMCSTIVHRGPDEEGLKVHGPVGLGMRRLAIIDLSGGSQPIHNEDRSIWTVFNGEIYNYREFRSELEERGHTFRTSSDTETLVHGYEEYGPDFADKLNGMFAFAVYDSKRSKVCLARDHVGIKPLYYALTKDHLVFGSEIKAILASGLVARSLDLNSLSQFLAWEYVPGEATLFREIRQLGPGQVVEVDLTEPTIEPRTFWDVPPPGSGDRLSAEEWEEELAAKVRECVRRQLVSDVPLGAFLSGGVDSSLVVAAMGEAQTFSIGFEEKSYNELEWARKAADHLGVDHRDKVIRPDVVSLFDRLMYHLDDPIADFSIFPTYLVSAHARETVTVSLAGDGGDELFGGYETYVAELMARQYGRLPGILRKGLIEPAVGLLKPTEAKKGLINKALRFVEGLGYAPELGHARWRIFAGPGWQQRILTPEARTGLTVPINDHILKLSKAAGDRGPVSRALYVDFKSYLVDNCLVKTDRMSMAASLEARVPLLDKELVELAFRLPDGLKVRDRSTKVLLKKVAAKQVPRDCVYRPKEGFSIPIKHWLGGRFRPLMDDLLEPGRLDREGIFESRTVERLKAEHLEGKANHSHLLWAMMIFQAWRRRWLEGPING